MNLITSGCAEIHPTAFIDSRAKVGKGVKIGPFSVIGGEVELCDGVEIGSHTVLEGCTTIGSGTKIGHFCAIGGVPQDMKYSGEKTALEIGKGNVIREYVSVHVGTSSGGKTCVGDYNWIMSYVHIAHDCKVGSHIVFSSNAQIAGHVEVGDWAILGGMCGVHQFVRIGAHSFLGGASALVQDLPPYMIAVGDKASARAINVKGLTRRKYTKEQIHAIRNAYRIFYSSNMSKKQALICVEQQYNHAPCFSYIKEIVDFIRSTQRGVIGFVSDDVVAVETGA